MFTFFSVIVIGFFLGMRHATDPDHVIAVTTIVSHQRSTRRAALIGVFWGLGHTVTIFTVGTVIILFDLVLPARLGLGMELSVGVMLIVLGGWNLTSFLRSVPVASIHSHPHRHGDYIHNHPHDHEPEAHPHLPEQNPLAKLDQRFGKVGLYQFLRPLVVGIVHGLAGSAAVALLVMASIRDSRWAIAYLLVFGLGTIAGMMLITMSIASTFQLVGHRFERFSQRLGMLSGLVSVGFGLVLAYQICIVQGLFTASPQWTPH
jgi:ABC-type nickel/cobalt efflux system permease component RcnA